ncbi:MAG TPA: molybdate ABC transporter substrate-binding protein [Vicinamibacterales bacterium]
MLARTLAAVAAMAAAAVLIPAVQRPLTGPQSVRIAAAADLRFALEEARARLSARTPPLTVHATYGSSGNLHAQLRQRAPFDLFLSADVAYPEDLVRGGVANEGDLFTYALGRLVVWVPGDSGLPIERDGLRALGAAQRIAIANPAHAPYGRAAESALRGADLWDDLRARLVLGENVAQAAQFVDSGAADAGIIAKSLAVAGAMRDKGRAWEVPHDQYPALLQGGLILRWAQSRPAAIRFRDYLLGGDGRELLTRNGFGLPPR